MMELFDTHAHLDDARFDPDREALIAALPSQDVQRVITVGADLPTSHAAAALAARHPMLYAAAGVHPHDAGTLSREALEELRAVLSQPKVCALGEIGLDYHYDHSPRDVQRHAFDAQMALAAALGKPVIIHDREAHGDTLETLRAYRGRVQGVMHCFSGSLEVARQCIDWGYAVSIAGPVTFKNARSLPEVAACIPIESLLIETDCPYLSPTPYRGQRNEPAYVGQIALCIAQLRGMDVETLAHMTFENACRVFGIDYPASLSIFNPIKLR